MSSDSDMTSRHLEQGTPADVASQNDVEAGANVETATPAAVEAATHAAQVTPSDAFQGADLIIKVDDVSKCYPIYERPQDRLKQSLYPRIQRRLGKEPKQYFREFWALRGISFEVRRGETVGIIGRNGSGKSTLLQLVCETLTPTAGEVQTHGRIAALLELGSGFNPEFTGRENVHMNASLLGLTDAQIAERYDDIVAFADIGEFIDQ